VVLRRKCNGAQACYRSYGLLEVGCWKLDIGGKRKVIRSYHDLDVYKRSYKLALDIHKMSFDLPQRERFELSTQIRRAAVSIPLNIAEGYGRKDSEKEFKHFARNSLGSCNEVQVLLAMLKDLSYIKQEVYESFSEEYIILGKQLTVLIKKWQNI
jgi:four helix bundle protein